ncbi:MAG: hypothetical protein KF763_14105 [Cyclobacteriaceae bacterium]|nr:hypothetical protein [Cyclobacteriaceae bacterium]
MKVHSAIPVTNMKDAFREGSFNGSIILGGNEDVFSFHFENSVLTKGKYSKNGKAAACRDAEDALNCAGRDFENMGPFSTALCVGEFPFCMAALVLDCVYRGCDRPDVPQVPQS